MTFRPAFRQRYLWNAVLAAAAIMLLVWTMFPFLWILLTSLKSPADVISVPPTFVFTPTIDNYSALVIGEQHGQYASARPDFPRFFLNSIIISIGAVALSIAAGIPAAYALARYNFPFKNVSWQVRLLAYWTRKTNTIDRIKCLDHCTYSLRSSSDVCLRLCKKLHNLLRKLDEERLALLRAVPLVTEGKRLICSTRELNVVKLGLLQRLAQTLGILGRKPLS